MAKLAAVCQYRSLPAPEGARLHSSHYRHSHSLKEKVMTQSHSGAPSAAADNPIASRRDVVAAAVTIAAVAGAADGAQAQAGSTVRRFDPPGLTSPPTYNHVVEVNGPHRVVYIAGQTGVDQDGKVAQGFQAQAVQVMENIKIGV